MAHENRHLEPSHRDIGEQTAQHTLAANPLVGVRGRDILHSARVLVGQMMRSPFIATKYYVGFLCELGRIATGGSELQPEAKDKRFSDPAWTQNVAYRALVQSYLRARSSWVPRVLSYIWLFAAGWMLRSLVAAL